MQQHQLLEHTGSVIKSVRSTSYGSVTNTVTGARRADSFAQGSGYVTNSATDAGGTVYQTHR